MEKSTLKEKAVHGTNAYPYATYEWHGMGEYEVPLHWHKENEIIFLTGGTFTLRLNMKKRKVKAPALIFIEAEAIHSILLENGKTESAIVFDMGMLGFEMVDSIQYKLIYPLLNRKIHFPQILTPEDSVWEQASKLYQNMFSECKKRELGAYLKVKADFYQLLACLYEGGYFESSKEISDRDLEKIDMMKKVLSYIQKNYEKKIRISEIASVAGMNEQYFCRYFKKNTGKTLTEYLNDIRIERACRELIGTDDKIIEVAGRCGYDNVGYFIRRFQKCKGVTPTEYRNKKSK